MKNKEYESMIRVNHAGEFGAVQIYKGQLAVLRRRETKKMIETMLSQEEDHFAYFDTKLKNEHIRPTILTPFWRVMGFALGAGTALLGRRAAMVCTVAVEEVIEEHYEEQLQHPELNDDLKDKIKEFQNDEIHHKEQGIEKFAKAAPCYPVLRQMIRQGTKLAIFLSKKI
ncbi:MAG: demethoxyubiquinone hydroxylase family protein [Alphaproteobacteria bacterium]|nr:demethoxyubiquinone hydroxylase family protein [Alphaproteobacteria bacterium]